MESRLLLTVLGFSLCCLCVFGDVLLETIVPGDGKTYPKNEWTVLVDYTGMLENGEVFDSTNGKKPFSFIVGRGQVIPGWDEGVKSMSKGEFARLTIPPYAAYGEDGIPGVIPPNATLIFEIALKSVFKAPLHISIEDVVFGKDAMPQP